MCQNFIKKIVQNIRNFRISTPTEILVPSKVQTLDGIYLSFIMNLKEACIQIDSIKIYLI